MDLFWTTQLDYSTHQHVSSYHAIIVSLNVRGLRGRKRYRIYRWLNDNNFDVCLLQESYCTESFVSVMKQGWNGKIFHSYSASEHSKGVCILFRKGLELDILSVHCDDVGRLIVVNFELNNVNCSVCNVYCPNNVTERIKFLADTKDFVLTHATTNSRICILEEISIVHNLQLTK